MKWNNLSNDIINHIYVFINPSPTCIKDFLKLYLHRKQMILSYIKNIHYIPLYHS